MDHIATIGDMREAARRRLPRPIFDFMDGAAFHEVTLRANTDDFEAIRFRLRPMRDVSTRNLSTTLLGQQASMPAATAPIGLGGVMYGNDGEKLVARAAEKAGIPFTLGMLSIATIEEVRAQVQNPFWFQFCMLKDRGLTKALLDKAIEAGCPVLMMTVTWSASGLQSRMVRSGLNLPPRINLQTFWDFALKPLWVARFLTGKRVGFNNFEGLVDDPCDLPAIVGQLDNSMTWKDLEWLREVWPGKIVIKGINSSEDANLAMEHGVDGVSVSNHGGNQLDHAASTISVLPHVAEGVDGRGTVLLDSGVRSGQDILKALALGADGVLLGRAHLYGLGAYGQKGVEKALELIRYELDVSTAQTGLTDVRDASPKILV
ncbi:MAG: alpha-hydroxy acid oxidase [Alphaproteobacteria bacterium]